MAAIQKVEVRVAAEEEVDVTSAWREFVPNGEISYPSEAQFRFIVETEVRHMPPSAFEMDLDEMDLDVDFTKIGQVVTVINRFSVPVRFLQTDPHEAKWTIKWMLLSLDDPCEAERESVLEIIQKFAQTMMMTREPSDGPPCMRVGLKGSTIDFEDEAIDEGDLIDVSALDDVCPICLEDFAGCRGGCDLRRLPCSHVFHSVCLAPWRRKSTLCPYCRHDCPRPGDAMYYLDMDEN